MLALLCRLDTLMTVASHSFAQEERACRLGGQAGKHGEQVVLRMLGKSMDSAHHSLRECCLGSGSARAWADCASVLGESTNSAHRSLTRVLSVFRERTRVGWLRKRPQ